jgi:cyanophycinase-like exopeptidase
VYPRTATWDSGSCLTGFGLVQNIIFDQHVSQRGRMGRL